MKAKLLTVAALMLATSSCGLMLDDRSAALDHDDVIHNGSDELVCEYPPMLTTGSHAVDLRACEKIEGASVGEELTFDVGGETVTIDSWVEKDGEGEFVGFTVVGDVVVVVKAGQELFEAGEGDWSHPAGTSGRNAKGISFVAFCEPPTGEPVCTPGSSPGSGPGGDTPSGSGDPGGDGGSDDPGYCDPETCEPGGQLGGGGSNDGGDDSSDGGDGGAGSGDGGTGSGDGGTGSGDGGTGSGDGGTGSGDGGACAVAPCGADNACGTNEACFSGCCVEVVL